jgi:hypothetical protein
MMAFKAKNSSQVPDFRGQQFFTCDEHLYAGTRHGTKGRAAGGGGERSLQFIHDERQIVWDFVGRGGCEVRLPHEGNRYSRSISAAR